MYTVSEVKSIATPCPRVKIYVLTYSGPPPRPGQFFMVWIPRVGEIPISAASYGDGEIKIAISRRGRVTGSIHDNVRVGDRIYLRGPYGRGFTIPSMGERALLVGGGVGAAPLLFLAEEIRRRGGQCDALLGFESRDNTIFLEEFKAACEMVWVATEDGSIGFKGMIHEALRQILQQWSHEAIYLCGPEPMMLRVLELDRIRSSRLEASLERYMRCGIGICGTCVLEPLGLRVCADGPVFPLEILLEIEGFGKWWRDFDSRKIPI